MYRKYNLEDNRSILVTESCIELIIDSSILNRKLIVQKEKKKLIFFYPDINIIITLRHENFL